MTYDTFYPTTVQNFFILVNAFIVRRIKIFPAANLAMVFHIYIPLASVRYTNSIYNFKINLDAV